MRENRAMANEQAPLARGVTRKALTKKPLSVRRATTLIVAVTFIVTIAGGSAVLEIDLGDEELAVEAAPVRSEIDRIDLERATEARPPGYRALLVLHDIEGYTHRETADGTKESR